MKLVNRFQKIFDEMVLNEVAQVPLSMPDVSNVLALLKADEALMKALNDHMSAGFKKAEMESE